MLKRILFVFSLLFCFQPLIMAQKAKKHPVKLTIRVIEEDTRKVTPVMICITNVKDSQVYMPPAGDIAGPPTYPNYFIKGVAYDAGKEWHGPIRKMNGMGAVNGARTYVYGLLPSFPWWKEPVMYQVPGDFTIALPTGEWRISISHGNEYVPVTDRFFLDGKSRKVSKTYLLKRWINLPEAGWFSGDVHAHHPVNKPAFKEYLLQLAKAEDVHLVNMLEMGDRNMTEFRAEGFGDKYRIERGNYHLVFGQEEPRSDYGHILGLNIAALARDTAHYNYYDLVFNKLHQKPEALVGFAHFAYRGEGVVQGMALYAPTGAVDFVELLQNSKINTTDYYEYLNIGFRIAAAAGSDFPWGSSIGDGRTFVYTGQPFSVGAWYAGLKAGRTFVSNGPALFLTADGQLPGTALNKSKGSITEINVKAISNAVIGKIDRVELYNNDGLLMAQKNTAQLDSVEIKLSHVLTKSQWLAAAVYCENSALAHTSPVYFLVDGAPVFDKEKGPAIVEKLLRVIEDIRITETNKDKADSGILSRAAQAEAYYKKLLKEHLP